MNIPLLVSTDWLAARLNDPRIRVVDTRWYLLNPEQGREEYGQAHIPGAVYLHIDHDLARPPYHGPGRHPLPSAEEFAAVASRAGIARETHVIAYDAQGGSTAARLWWLLRYFGHDAVSLLDGGIPRWVAENRPLQKETPSVPRAEFDAQPRTGWVVNQAQVDALRRDAKTLLIDSRLAERYEGKTEPIDARAGHIPGARSAPLAGNLRGADDPRFREPDRLREQFAQLGAERAETIVAYCGSGVNACASIFALELAGFKDALLYEGSWSDWSRNPNLPAATDTI
jgi:thiosulfate/3-mercaptopyruvate sulfurtransferase